MMICPLLCLLFEVYSPVIAIRSMVKVLENSASEQSKADWTHFSSRKWTYYFKDSQVVVLGAAEFET